MPQATAVCLGAVDAGKTSLLRRLQSLLQEEIEDFPAPLLQPTIGINHFSLTFEQSQEKHSCLPLALRSRKTTKLVAKEFGGALAPVWKSYLKNILEESGNDLKAILFAIDIANAGRLAESCVHLLEILHIVKDTDIKVLIVFTKADLLDESSFQRVLRETRALLRIDFLHETGYKFETLTVSSQTDFGLDQLIEFLRDTAAESAK